MNGFVIIHRKITEWEWYTHPATRIVFEHLLILSNHTPNKWQGILVDRGERISSIANIAKETGFSVRQVRTAIKNLKSTNELTSESTSRFTLFKVKNYDKYQASDKVVDKQATSKRQASDKQATTNNNDNNDNNDNNEEKEKSFLIFYSAYPNKKAKLKAKQAWEKVNPADYEQIMKTLEAQKQSEEWKKERGKYIPFPASWLNGKRWEDETKTLPTKKQLEAARDQAMRTKTFPQLCQKIEEDGLLNHVEKIYPFLFRDIQNFKQLN